MVMGARPEAQTQSVSAAGAGAMRKFRQPRVDAMGRRFKTPVALTLLTP